jgi:hypothetical protein
VAAAVRKGKGRRAVRVRLDAPVAGRLEVRVLDVRNRMLARGATRFVRAGKRTLTIKPARRGRAAVLRLRWAPEDGAAETYKKRL